MYRIIKMVSLTLALNLALVSCGPSVQTDSILTRGASDSEYIILTDELTKGEEYHGYEEHNIPLRIFIQDGKIIKVEAYGHIETPDYFADVEAGLLNKWNGKTIQEALALQVDAISGATYSSEAVIKSVEVGLQYAQKAGVK